jgi:AAA+ superfamily predicted ATPase
VVRNQQEERSDQEVGAMTQQMVWKCEQWLGGRVKEQNVFMSEELAREFARKVAGMSPDLVFKIEPMPIQHVWN